MRVRLSAAADKPAVFAVFLTNLYRSQPYKDWAKAHTSEASAWQTYANALTLSAQSAGTPSAPTLTTAFGKALLQVAQLAIAAAPIVGVVPVYGVAEYGGSDYQERP